MPITDLYSSHLVLQPPLRHAPPTDFCLGCTASNSTTKPSYGIPISSLSSVRMHKHRSYNASAVGIPRCSSATPPPPLREVEADRSNLKQQLLSAISSNNGNLNEECMTLISSLEKLNPNPDITLAPHLYTGCFEGISGSFRGTGRPGEAQKLVEQTVTLGRATFNAFKPTDIDIQLKQTYNHVGIEAEDAYYLLIQFYVKDPGAPADGPAMEGMFINRATFSVSDAARMDVKFESSTVVPVNPQMDLQSWLKLFKGANPTMDDKGSATVALPPAKGFLDYLYLDDDLRITRGNRGAVTVVTRLPQKIIHV
eukprot:Gb_13068 [translate_table: standard]